MAVFCSTRLDPAVEGLGCHSFNQQEMVAVFVASGSVPQKRTPKKQSRPESLRRVSEATECNIVSPWISGQFQIFGLPCVSRWPGASHGSGVGKHRWTQPDSQKVLGRSGWIVSCGHSERGFEASKGDIEGLSSFFRQPKPSSDLSHPNPPKAFPKSV